MLLEEKLVLIQILDSEILRFGNYYDITETYRKLGSSGKVVFSTKNNVFTNPVFEYFSSTNQRFILLLQ